MTNTFFRKCLFWWA